LHYADVRRDETNTALCFSQAAQVHAILYLAEQQRIGNLIALGSMQTSKETWATSARDEWVDEALSALADREPREGLGLK